MKSYRLSAQVFQGGNQYGQFGEDNKECSKPCCDPMPGFAVALCRY